VTVLDLTPQECRIINLARDGATPSEIADALGVASSTVRDRIRKIAVRIGAEPGGIRAVLDRADELEVCEE
jgi:DNA-binding NarL/FixJ family response regulator